MGYFIDDEIPHKKYSKRKKKHPKKSDHKHDYELVEIIPKAIKNWFTHKKVCTICGKVYTELRIVNEENDHEDIL